MKILPNLNPLRFFLATTVVLFHVPQLCKNQGLPFFDDLPIFHRGVEAVYMFFVLSGFLIIRSIYIAKMKGTFSIKNFYMRRVLRIFPLYYLIVFFGFFFYNVFLPALDIPYPINYDLKTGLLLTIFFIPNMFVQYSPGGILEVLWSIGIEEQFYILIAPLLYLISKNKIFKALLFIASIYFIVFHLEFFKFLRTFNFVYFYMLSGGLIAILEEKNKLNFIKNNKILPVIIVLCTVVFFTTNLFQFENLIVKNLFITILFSLFIYLISFANSGVILKNTYLDYLGKISYGIYMYHVIALNIVVFVFLKIEKYSFNDTISILLIYVITLGLTIVIAHFSYQYFEKYFLSLKEKFRK